MYTVTPLGITQLCIKNYASVSVGEVLIMRMNIRPNITYPLSSLLDESKTNKFWNLPQVELLEIATSRGEGHFSQDGAFCVQTGKYTGRLAQDKYSVVYPEIENEIWFHDGNKKMEPELGDRLFREVELYLSKQDIFVNDVYAGSEPSSRVNVRLITHTAWHAAFCINLLYSPKATELTSFPVEFTIFHAPDLTVDSTQYNLHSGSFIILDLIKKRVLIAGTHYAGEIKKSVFSLMNYILPRKGIMSMHCAVNVGKNDHVGIFFGLSGTGKTTLSSSENRALIGDDEHGWSDQGVFNVEAGCYAKMINLSRESEPGIYTATHQFGAILENTVFYANTRKVNLDDCSLTENTRGSYSLNRLENIYPNAYVNKQPSCILMLTADAFGVLPPVSKLNSAQATYHFLSGYTAKVGGTEEGIKEPTATFSTCFGAPFMLLRPEVYANLLSTKIQKGQVQVFLVNTGWSGGQYGVGKRMSIQVTRNIVNAILDGHLNQVSWETEPYFGLQIPTTCPNVDSTLLSPSNSWVDKEQYTETATKLKSMFAKNFKQYHDKVTKDVVEVSF